MKTIGGIPIALLDSRYLRLDCVNSPLTGDLAIQAVDDESYHLYLDQYSDNPDRYGRLYFRKSQSNTAGTVLETLDGTFLGNIKYMGVNDSDEFAGGCYMSVQQIGDSGDYVPTRMEWATYSAIGVNDDQFVMNPDGTINTSGDLTVGGDLIISGNDLFMTTNTANFFLMADGTNYNPTSPANARTGLGLGELAVLDDLSTFSTTDLSEGTNLYYTDGRVGTYGDARYLQILNDLSDLDNAGDARTNLGLIAGGTGDIWVEKAGDTMSGDLGMADEKVIYFDTAKTRSLGYRATHTDPVWGTTYPVITEGLCYIVANTGADGAGSWEPNLRLAVDGTVGLFNSSQGAVGSKYFQIEMTDGIRLKTGGSTKSAILLSDNIATANKTFQFPNASGELAVLSDVTGGQTLLTNSGATGAITILDNGNVGIGTAEPLAELHTTGGRIVNTTRETTTYTVLVTDDAIYCDTDGAAWTLTLPAGVDGQRFFITNCGGSGNDLTIDGDGSEEINGELTQLLSDEDSIIIIFESTEGWRVF